MPPNKSKGKAKKGAKKGGDGGNSGDEFDKEKRAELIRQALSLRQEAVDERESLSDFRHKAEQIQYFWKIEKTNLEVCDSNYCLDRSVSFVS